GRSYVRRILAQGLMKMPRGVGERETPPSAATGVDQVLSMPSREHQHQWSEPQRPNFSQPRAATLNQLIFPIRLLIGRTSHRAHGARVTIAKVASNPYKSAEK